MPFRLVAAGDAALLVEFEGRIDPVVNATVIALADAVEAANLPGVRDVVPTYRSVALYFDPLHTDYRTLVRRVTEEASAVVPGATAPPVPIRVPVCYEDEYAPDLGSLARAAGLAEAEVVRLHTSRTYRVFMLGFVPGFAYMGSVDGRIAALRRATPRARVPAGSVGIAGSQTGVYPMSTPGGWQLIGRTPLKPFDPGRPKPFLFAPGDAVEFYPIARTDFAEWNRA